MLCKIYVKSSKQLKRGQTMLQSRMLQSRTCLATAFHATCYNFFCSMLDATLSNMFVVN